MRKYLLIFYKHNMLKLGNTLYTIILEITISFI